MLGGLGANNCLLWFAKLCLFEFLAVSINASDKLLWQEQEGSQLDKVDSRCLKENL